MSSLIGGIGGAIVGMAGGALLGSMMAPDAPDTSGMNASAVANSAVAGRAQDLADKQYADQMRIYEQYAPLYKQQAEASIAAQTKSTAQSDSAWGDYQATWKPVEQKLAAKSLAYSDPGRVEQEGQRAGSLAQTQVDRAQRETEMSLSQAGASPEKIAALMAAGRVSGAKTIGAAEYQGRSDAEAKGMAYLDNAAKFGRGMPSTGLETARLAGQQGSLAQGAAQNQQSSAAAAATSAAPLLNTAINANNSAGRLFGGAADLTFQGDMAKYNATMGGVGAGNYMAGKFPSSEKIKDVGSLADGGAASDAIERSPSKRWRYKPGEGDGDTAERVGPMAENLAAVAPQVSDGKTVDMISMQGLHHASLGDHNKRLKRLERAANRKD